MICRRQRGDLKANTDREGGFTVVELLLAMVLFGIIGYAALSLVSTTLNTTARTLAEFDSRKSVLLLHREMAEGTANYAGYLAASRLFFGAEAGSLYFQESPVPPTVCVFRIWFPNPDPDGEPKERKVEYIWRSDTGELYQRVDDVLGVKPLLTNVARLSVTRPYASQGQSSFTQHTIRVEIGHKVKGFTRPIVRATEGQARNMSLDSEEAMEIGECSL